MIASAAWMEALGVAACASTGAMAYAVRYPSSTWLAPSIHRGVATRRAIALTFDDGPSESTPRLLDILARRGVRATFFQCGVNVRRLPAVARQVRAASHEIGNHTDSHPRLDLKSPAFMDRELSAAQDAIGNATGERPRFFRAPYGVRWFGLRGVQHRLGLMGVMWTTIGVDWEGPEEPVVKRLLRGAKNGAIFCLHDGREIRQQPDIGVTLRAVDTVLPILIDRGFHFEKVSEIICPTKN
jgi:peptidoglycan/xylan/chitin deacetylase (PgdA/CDA1 family)